jgi:hypothetical protein
MQKEQRSPSEPVGRTDTAAFWLSPPARADVPTYFDALSGRADSGFTNVTPAIKWQISPVPGKIDLSATFGAGLPTGTRAQPFYTMPSMGRRVRKSLRIAKPAAAAARCLSVCPLTIEPTE